MFDLAFFTSGLIFIVEYNLPKLFCNGFSFAHDKITSASHVEKADFITATCLHVNDMFCCSVIFEYPRTVVLLIVEAAP